MAERKKQVIFPLVLESLEDKERIQALAREAGCAQSEALRCLLSIALEAIDAGKGASRAQEWLLRELMQRVRQPWEKRIADK